MSFAARARSARAANDTTRAQINNIPEKSHFIIIIINIQVGGAVAQWLVRWTPDRAVRAQSLARALRCVLGHSASLHPGV